MKLKKFLYHYYCMNGNINQEHVAMLLDFSFIVVYFPHENLILVQPQTREANYPQIIDWRVLSLDCLLHPLRHQLVLGDLSEVEERGFDQRKHVLKQETNIYVCVYIYTHVYKNNTTTICICIRYYTYNYIYIYIYTYIYIYIYMCDS